MKSRIPIVLLGGFAVFALPSAVRAQVIGPMAEGGNDKQGYDMARERTPAVVEAAVEAISTKPSSQKNKEFSL